jgi:hypothetical protein
MNEKLKELAEQAGLDWGIRTAYEECLEIFAELVRDDERAKCASDYLSDCAAAVEAARIEEREACAKLCEAYIAPWIGKEIAAAIRRRTE